MCNLRCKVGQWDFVRGLCSSSAYLLFFVLGSLEGLDL